MLYHNIVNSSYNSIHDIKQITEAQKHKTTKMPSSRKRGQEQKN